MKIFEKLHSETSKFSSSSTFEDATLNTIDFIKNIHNFNTVYGVSIQGDAAIEKLDLKFLFGDKIRTDINHPGHLNDYTLMEEAICRKSTILAKKILPHSYDIQQELASYGYVTCKVPLHLAIHLKNAPMVEYLLELGADPHHVINDYPNGKKNYIQYIQGRNKSKSGKIPAKICPTDIIILGLLAKQR